MKAIAIAAVLLVLGSLAGVVVLDRKIKADVAAARVQGYAAGRADMEAVVAKAEKEHEDAAAGIRAQAQTDSDAADAREAVLQGMVAKLKARKPAVVVRKCLDAGVVRKLDALRDAPALQPDGRP